MTVNLWGMDIIPTGDDVDDAMLCHRNVTLGRETWEEHQETIGVVATFLQTIVDLCLAGF